MSFWIHCDEESCEEVILWEDDNVPESWTETSNRERQVLPNDIIPADLLAFAEQVIEKTKVTVVRHFCSKHQFPKYKVTQADQTAPQEFKLDPELERMIARVKLPERTDD